MTLASTMAERGADTKVAVAAEIHAEVESARRQRLAVARHDAVIRIRL